MQKSNFLEVPNPKKQPTGSIKGHTNLLLANEEIKEKTCKQRTTMDRELTEEVALV